MGCGRICCGCRIGRPYRVENAGEEETEEVEEIEETSGEREAEKSAEEIGEIGEGFW